MKTLRNILIVEDNIFYQEMIKNHFSDHNYQVDCYESGEEFFRQNTESDLILLDYHLAGELNGLDILKRLKSEGSMTPVIFLSGQEDIHIAINSLKLGAFDYVIKDENAFNQIDEAISRFLIFSEAREAKNKKSFFKFFRRKD